MNKELREEIVRLITYYSLPVGPTGTGPAYAALRELAAFCYRDAERVCIVGAEIFAIQPGPRNEGAAMGANACAEVIARRAEELT